MSGPSRQYTLLNTQNFYTSYHDGETIMYLDEETREAHGGVGWRAMRRPLCETFTEVDSNVVYDKNSGVEPSLLKRVFFWGGSVTTGDCPFSDRVNVPPSKYNKKGNQGIPFKYPDTNRPFCLKNPKKVDDGSLVLATLFYSKKKELCQVITQREMLEHLYFYTMVEWATDDIKKDWYKHRQFSQVLYALAKGLKVVNVYNRGKSLYWKSPTARATFTH